MNWTPDALDRLERAVADRTRVEIRRRGSVLILLPERIRTDYGDEVLEARHPGTGEMMELPLEEVEGFVVLD